MTAVGGQRSVTTGGRTAIHREGASHVTGGCAEIKRGVISDLVCVGAGSAYAEAVINQIYRRSSDGFVQGKRNTGAGTIAGSIGVKNCDRMTAVGGQRSVTTGGRTAIHREGASHVTGGCAEIKRGVISDLVCVGAGSAYAEAVIGQIYRRSSNGFVQGKRNAGAGTIAG